MNKHVAIFHRLLAEHLSKPDPMNLHLTMTYQVSMSEWCSLARN
jgi:hypothetical protein